MVFRERFGTVDRPDGIVTGGTLSDKRATMAAGGLKRLGFLDFVRNEGESFRVRIPAPQAWFCLVC